MKGMENRRKIDHRGMTLVEIMVAMVLLAIALAWLAPLLVVSMRSNRLGADLTRATTVAQDKLEEFRNKSFASLLSNPIGQDTVGTIVRDWTITQEPDQSGLLRIVLLLNWQDDDGQDHQISFTTLQARAK
jgi:prepilin-type N-terminal cleavage/methylation domain-containing protein